MTDEGTDEPDEHDSGARRAVERLWARPTEGGAMEERAALEIVAGQGVEGDHTFGRMRHATIVFSDDWAAATRDLGREVDASARRANILVSGAGGGRLIGRRVRIGQVVVDVKGETKPCPVMDAAAEGLKDALEPDCRAGVWGRIVVGGTLVPGDLLVEDT